MKQIFIIIFVSISFNIIGQDSLRKCKLKLFDGVIHLGLTGFTTNALNLDKIFSYTNNQAVKDESKGYKVADDYGAIYKPMALSIGINATGKFSNAKNNLIKRIKPRCSISYYQITLFDQFQMTYTNKVIKDTFPPATPGDPEQYSDSVTYGKLQYQYTSSQVLTEVGANIDILVKKRFILYTGILYGYGFSLKNKFIIDKYEYGYQHSPTNTGPSERLEINDYQHVYIEPKSSISRITVPVGAQLRLGMRRPYSFGFFWEVRFGLERYQTKNGGSITHYIYPFTFGIRFNWMYHK